MQIETFEHYIRIITDSELDNDTIKQYYKIVKQHLGDIIEPDDDGNVLVYHINEKGNHCYDINLSEDVNPVEGDAMSLEISDLIPEDIDLQIEATSDTQIEADVSNEDQYIGEGELSDFSDELHRYKHNRWMDKLVSEGWRYGNKYNEVERVHPRLRPWDELPQSMRHVDNELPNKIIEYLGQKGYSIIRK